MCVEYYRYLAGKEVEKLGVVLAHAHDCFYLAAYKVFYFGVVVAFVLAAQYEHGAFCVGHAFERVPAGIYVCGLGVVYVYCTAFCGRIFKTVFNSFEVFKGATYVLAPYVEQACRQSGCHGVV